GNSKRLRGRVYLVCAQVAVLQLAALGGGVIPTITALAASYSQTVLGDSPLVYYRLDETSGSTAADSSGNGRTGAYAASGITYGGSTVLLYVDGQQLRSWSAGPANTSVPSQGLQIGNGPDGAFGGSLDEVAVYGTALSATQLNNHWRAGVGATCSSTPTSGYAGAVVAD